MQTGAVPILASHPLKFYFDYGLRVTINTDNRLITDTTVTKELWLAHQELGLSLEDLTTIIVSGFKSAFLPFREKQDMLRQVNQEIATTLAAFEKRRRRGHAPAGLSPAMDDTQGTPPAPDLDPCARAAGRPEVPALLMLVMAGSGCCTRSSGSTWTLSPAGTEHRRAPPTRPWRCTRRELGWMRGCCPLPEPRPASPSALPGVCLNGLVVFGAWKMKNLQLYGWP